MRSLGRPFIVLIFAISAAAQNRADPDSLRSIEAAQRALRENPDAEDNRVTLAALDLRAGQNRSAVELLSPWVKLHTEATQALRLLATGYLRGDNFAEAKTTASQALERGPRDAATLVLLAMSQLGLQETADAEKLLLEAQKRDPDSLEANLQLGLLYSKQQRNLPDAIRALRKAKALQPDLAGTSAALGSALLASGDVRGAATELEAAVRLAPETAEPYYLLASAFRALHEDEKSAAALAAFNTRKRAEADLRAREMRGRADYEEGVNLLSNTDKLDDAYAALARSARELQDFDAAYYRMAQVSYLKGDMRSALVSIREALRLNPWEPEYYYVLARCLQESDPQAARDAVGKAIAFRPGVPDFEELLRELKAP
jgi:tetratricopeptide (TPR) repeat protein